jgi:hypothetical protein
MRARGLLVAAILCTASSCQPPSPRLLLVPYGSAVERVVVSPMQSSLDSPKWEVVIDDPKVVERLLAFLRARDDGWEKTWHTFPAGQLSVWLKRGDELLMVLWVGQNWIGCRERDGGATGDRLRSISADERGELLDILSVPSAASATPRAAR